MIPEDFRLAVYVVLSAISWLFWRLLALFVFVGIPLLLLTGFVGLMWWGLHRK